MLSGPKTHAIGERRPTKRWKLERRIGTNRWQLDPIDCRQRYDTSFTGVAPASASGAA